MINHLTDMYNLKLQTVRQFGLDNTGQIEYYFNQQGFRSRNNFDQPPMYAFFGCSSVFGIGVNDNSVTTSYFNNAYNFGLAGNYTNQDILHTIKQFLNSSLYSPTTTIITVWTDRDQDYLNNYINSIEHNCTYNFFCGDLIPGKKNFKFVQNLDLDVSNTHMGPQTHKLFAKILCSLLNR